MTKVLNLDELETNFEKTIVLNGVEYKMKPFSVEEFIDQMKEINSTVEKDLDGVQMYELSLRVIRRAFPGMTDELIKQMNTFQVDAIYSFIKEKVDDEVDTLVETSGGND